MKPLLCTVWLPFGSETAAHLGQRYSRADLIIGPVGLLGAARLLDTSRWQGHGLEPAKKPVSGNRIP